MMDETKHSHLMVTHQMNNHLVNKHLNAANNNHRSPP